MVGGMAVVYAAPSATFASQSAGPTLLVAGSVASHRSGPLHFDYELLAFGAANRRTESVLAVSVDGARMSPRVDSDGWGYTVTARLELLRDTRLVALVTDTVALACTGRLAQAHGVPVYLTARVEPGQYDFRLALTDPHRPRGNPTSVAEGRLIVPSFEGPGPALSPLAVATDSAADRWDGVAGGLQVNPTHLVANDSPPLIYFEVYGVSPGASVRTDLTLAPVERAGALDRLLRGRARPYVIRYRERAPADPGVPIRSTLRLALENLRPGQYSITARVTEVSGGNASLPMTSSLRLVDARRSGYRSAACEPARTARQ
jgi:hypothetical protein